MTAVKLAAVCNEQHYSMLELHLPACILLFLLKGVDVLGTVTFAHLLACCRLSVLIDEERY